MTHFKKWKRRRRKEKTSSHVSRCVNVAFVSVSNGPMWYMNLDHIFRDWERKKKRNITMLSKKASGTDQPDDKCFARDFKTGQHMKQERKKSSERMNERKINDRITENSGRKTVFPISFGISCSWNWQSLALSLSPLVSSDRHDWFSVQQVTVNWFIFFLSLSLAFHWHP